MEMTAYHDSDVWMAKCIAALRSAELAETVRSLTVNLSCMIEANNCDVHMYTSAGSLEIREYDEDAFVAALVEGPVGEKLGTLRLLYAVENNPRNGAKVGSFVATHTRLHTFAFWSSTVEPQECMAESVLKEGGPSAWLTEVSLCSYPSAVHSVKLAAATLLNRAELRRAARVVVTDDGNDANDGSDDVLCNGGSSSSGCNDSDSGGFDWMSVMAYRNHPCLRAEMEARSSDGRVEQALERYLYRHSSSFAEFSAAVMFLIDAKTASSSSSLGNDGNGVDGNGVDSKGVDDVDAADNDHGVFAK